MDIPPDPYWARQPYRDGNPSAPYGYALEAQRMPYPGQPYQQYPAQVMVTEQRTSTSHGLHLFLTIVTFGAWGFFVWMPITIWHKIGPRSKIVTYY